MFWQWKPSSAAVTDTAIMLESVTAFGEGLCVQNVLFLSSYPLGPLLTNVWDFCGVQWRCFGPKGPSVITKHTKQIVSWFYIDYHHWFILENLFPYPNSRQGNESAFYHGAAFSYIRYMTICRSFSFRFISTKELDCSMVCPFHFVLFHL